MDTSRPRSLRLAAVGGLTFTLLYLVHRLLQWTGPDPGADVAAYTLAHRGQLLASEVAVGLALLAFIGFLAPLAVVIWRAGAQTLAAAVLAAGTVFLAMGFASMAAETAVIGVADAGQPSAVLALDQLQGRLPIVWTITALAVTISLAVPPARLGWAWLRIAGLAAAAVFLLGSVFSLLGSTVEGRGSLIGVGLFIVWMLVLTAALWRAAATTG